ncbi:hypothetical protein I79_008470 [Cricetulus griseus]|uniref:Uncharacterized protein n=1 Tax=Cricetulus griseus TaxID=10029 RepID=G3HD92_CRIGR|nr:hypothetical protein I79_008470 [Cricetulus griseus]
MARELGLRFLHSWQGGPLLSYTLAVRDAGFPGRDNTQQLLFISHKAYVTAISSIEGSVEPTGVVLNFTSSKLVRRRHPGPTGLGNFLKQLRQVHRAPEAMTELQGSLSVPLSFCA